MADTKKRPRTAAARLSREEWLARALELLGRKGAGILTIEGIARHLGVTKGSFYWHFDNRDDFHRQLVEYWDRTYTRAVFNHLNSLELPPEERLRALMRVVHDQRMDRFEMPVRAWAQHNTALLPLVRKVDKRRLAFVEALFLELGFAADEAKLRSQVFLAYMVAQRFLLPPTGKDQQLDDLERRAAFFLRRPS